MTRVAAIASFVQAPTALIFISYKRLVTNTPRHLAEAMMAASLDIWFDEYQTKLGSTHSIVAQINAAVATADKAIFFASQSWLDSPYSWESEAVPLLARGVPTLVFLCGEPAPLRERIEQARGKSEVTYCSLGDTIEIHAALAALETFLNCRLPKPALPAQSGNEYGLIAGAVKFRMERFDWQLYQPSIAPSPEERSGPVLRKTCDTARLELNFFVSKTGRRRAQLDQDLADADVWKSHHKVFEYGVALAESILLGKMDRMRAMPGFADGEKQALLSQKGRKGFGLRRLLMRYQPAGVHLLSVCGLNQFAITYQIWGRYTRKYLVWVPDPQGGSDYELMFTAGVSGGQREFFNHAYEFDRVISSLQVS